MPSYVEGLVTVLTPAYNAEPYIGRLLKSIVSQSYSSIEMIIIDDGSADGTKEVIESFRTDFEKKSYDLYYLYQNNQGQSTAINRGLKFVRGEFLVWPDADDWYAFGDSIQKMVNVLSKSTDDVGALRCGYQRIKEDDFSVLKVDFPRQNYAALSLFDDVIKRKKNVWIEPGGWMVKTTFLDDLIPRRDIYSSKNTGQNYQILLPYLFSKKCVAIEEPLFCYLVRKNSHSRGMYDTYEKKCMVHQEVWTTQIKTLEAIKNMSDDRLRYYSMIVDRRMTCGLCLLDFTYDRQSLFIKHGIQFIKQFRTLYSIRYACLLMCSFFPFSFRVVRFLLGYKR